MDYNCHLTKVKRNVFLTGLLFYFMPTATQYSGAKLLSSFSLLDSLGFREILEDWFWLL